MVASDAPPLAGQGITLRPTTVGEPRGEAPSLRSGSNLDRLVMAWEWFLAVVEISGSLK